MESLLSMVKYNFQNVTNDYDSSRSSGLLGSQVVKERKLVLEFLDPKKKDIILDFGCGGGWLEKKLKQYNIYGYDINPQKTFIKDYRKDFFGNKTFHQRNLLIQEKLKSGLTYTESIGKGLQPLMSLLNGITTDLMEVLI